MHCDHGSPKESNLINIVLDIISAFQDCSVNLYFMVLYGKIILVVHFTDFLYRTFCSIKKEIRDVRFLMYF